jgi:hypothetical protein
MEDNFTPEQQRYLEGLVAGMTAARMTGGIPTLPAEPSGPMHRIFSRWRARKWRERNWPTRSASSAKNIRSMPMPA